MRSIVTSGYCLRDLNPRRQVVEMLRRFDLYGQVEPFRRCMRCNALLESVEKEAVFDRLEPLTRLYYHEFRRCPACSQVYWKGSHFQRMQRFISSVLERET
jgi:uncharacterized protein with PIN domain